MCVCACTHTCMHCMWVWTCDYEFLITRIILSVQNTSDIGQLLNAMSSNANLMTRIEAGEARTIIAIIRLVRLQYIYQLHLKAILVTVFTRWLIILLYCQLYLFLGMQVLQYPRYCNNSGSLTPLPCRVVNHCLVVQVLVRTEG